METLKQTMRRIARLIQNIGNPSLETMQQYRQDVARVLAGQTNIKAAASHYRYRAALKWYFQMHAGQLLNWFEEMGPHARPDDYPALATMLNVSLEVLQLLDGGTDSIQENLAAGLSTEFTPTEAATSKREGLDELPDDWRELMLEAVAHRPEHWIPLMILRLTGIRPRELHEGIGLAYFANDDLIIIRINGAKCTEDNGQPERELHFELANHQELSRLMHLLNVSPGKEINFHFPKRGLSNLIARLNRQLFPDVTIPVSPISFRHQFASDLKIAGRGRYEIATAMGHRSVRTQSGYGLRKSGHRGGVLPAKVVATHPIRSDSHIVSGPLDGAEPVRLKGPCGPHRS